MSRLLSVATVEPIHVGSSKNASPSFLLTWWECSGPHVRNLWNRNPPRPINMHAVPTLKMAQFGASKADLGLPLPALHQRVPAVPLFVIKCLKHFAAERMSCAHSNTKTVSMIAKLCLCGQTVGSGVYGCAWCWPELNRNPIPSGNPRRDWSCGWFILWCRKRQQRGLSGLNSTIFCTSYALGLRNSRDVFQRVLTSWNQ